MVLGFIGIPKLKLLNSNPVSGQGQCYGLKLLQGPGKAPNVLRPALHQGVSYLKSSEKVQKPQRFPSPSSYRSHIVCLSALFEFERPL